MSRKEFKAKGRRCWRLARVYFRGFRLLVWLVILALLIGLIYLNQTGLPSFLKDPILARLNARGIDLQFDRLRLLWYEGLVAENVQFGGHNPGNAPEFKARQAKVLLNWKALLRGRTQVDALVVRGGTLSWPVHDEERQARSLVLSNIQTELRFLPQDQWILDQFKASLASAGLELTARIDNASAVRDWPVFKGHEPKADTSKLRDRVRFIADTLEKISFPQPPKLVMDIRGDGRDPRSFSARLDIAAPGASTPWGEFSNGALRLRLHPTGEGTDFSASIELDAQKGATKWGEAEAFKLTMDLAQPETFTNRVQGKLKLSALSANTPWASGSNVLADVQWLHSITNPVPLWATGQVSCTAVQSRWASSTGIKLSGSLSSQTNPVATHSDWMWFTNLSPFQIEWECELEGIQSDEIRVDHASAKGTWAAPEIAVTSLSARLYDGKLAAGGRLNVDSCLAGARASWDFDVKRAEGLLTPGARKWLQSFTWKKPPEVEVAASAILPAWTNPKPDWREEVLPTLHLAGQFQARNGAGYRGAEADTASSHFYYSNLTWQLPDLVIVRPEGRLEAMHVANDQTRQYYWKLHSTVSPEIIRPLLQTNETRIFELLELSSPPEIEAEVWGTFHKYDLLGGRAFVKATNLSFRGQTATRVEAEAFYTNKVVRVVSPKVERGAEHASADAVIVDFNQQMVFITNAAGMMDPLAFSRAIGPKVGKHMEPYLFLRPPKVRVYGTVPMHGELGADLHFDVDGGPFHWWKFKMPRIAGQVHWKDYQLSLANVDADFYWGTARGNAVFDVSDLPGTEFMFSMSATNVYLKDLLTDLTASTNKSEGWVDGTIIVTRANANDWQTVQGYGDLKFHDGLLWDIPLFGVLSPVLDGVMPGLGSSRANEGACTYILTNGIFRTSNLEIRTLAMPMRLQYKGDVNLAKDYELNARVEAEILRNMWVVGPLVSTVLWPVTKMFEYRVGGTLGSPKLEPVTVVPHLFSVPFLPFRVLRELGGGSQAAPPPSPAQPIPESAPAK